jgi:hypothetical protein
VNALPVSGSRAASINSNRRRALLLAGSTALGHQHRDKGGPALAETRPAEILRRLPPQRQRQVEQARPRQRLAVFHHEIAQGGAVTLHAEGEHGAAGDLERHALHGLAQIDRGTHFLLQRGDGLFGHRDHVRDKGRDRARREGRRQRAALMFPGASLGDQKALTQHRPQHAEAGRRARVVLVIVDQHMPDGVGRIEDEAVAAEEAAADDVLFIGAPPPGGDGVFTHRSHPLQGRHVVGRQRRPGRHQRRAGKRQVICFRDAHATASLASGIFGAITELVSQFGGRNPAFRTPAFRILTGLDGKHWTARDFRGHHWALGESFLGRGSPNRP